jgi:hypothetical protein
VANESVMKGNVRLIKETFGQKLAFLEIAYTHTHTHLCQYDENRRYIPSGDYVTQIHILRSGPQKTQRHGKLDAESDSIVKTNANSFFLCTQHV